MIGFEFNDMLPEVAAAYPDVKFLQIDSCPFDKMQPNIFCSVFREYEASFLTGAEAALTTKTGKVGAIGALDIPFLHRYTDGFIKGAQHVKADIEVSPTLWVGGNNPFSDPARGQQRAAAMVAENADRVLAAGAGSNGGIFEAMQDLEGALRLRRRRESVRAGAGPRDGQHREEDRRRGRARRQGHHGRARSSRSRRSA